ncbi:MAG: hypothetical protein ACETWM_08535 [Candidatus Lokiarchaeia archaeon]
MTKHQKTKKLLLFLTLFSLSLLLVAPLAGGIHAQPNNTSFLTSTISAAQPENMTVGQTWKYRLTYQNATFTGSATFTEKITSIKSITDWNASTQECYIFQMRFDMNKLLKAFFGITVYGPDFFITFDKYINTTNFSNPRTDRKLMWDFPAGKIIEFRSYLRNETFHIYKFPLYDGLSWQKLVNQRVTGWDVDLTGTNTTISPFYKTTNITASVAGPINITVPAGTFETFQINYTNDIICELFSDIFDWYLDPDIDQVQAWYSLEAGNFVKYFMEVDTDENVTIEMITPFPSSILLFALSFSTQQQASTNLLLIGGLIAVLAVIATVGIVIVLVRRRG